MGATQYLILDERSARTSYLARQLAAAGTPHVGETHPIWRTRTSKRLELVTVRNEFSFNRLVVKPVSYATTARTVLHHAPTLLRDRGLWPQLSRAVSGYALAYLLPSRCSYVREGGQRIAHIGRNVRLLLTGRDGLTRLRTTLI